MEFIGFIFRLFWGLAEAVAFIDFIAHFFKGILWWFSPQFRKETKLKEDHKRTGVYLGACISPAVVIGLLYFAFT